MEKRIKTKIIKKALKIHGFNYQDYSGNVYELGGLVEDNPTEFIETCIEEAYKEGLAIRSKSANQKEKKIK